MRTLVVVRNKATFTEAARALAISASLVSRHVAALEQEVGVVLVDRTPQGIALTPAGKRYAVVAERVLREIADEDAAVALLRTRAEGTLNIASPKWISTLDFGDAVARFAVEHPRIAVRYEVGRMSERTYNFLDSGIDIAVHAKLLRNSSLIVTKVADARFVLCASPGYLAHGRALTRPGDLFDHKCLVHPNHPIWKFGRGRGAKHIKVPEPAFTSNAYLVLQKAARRGLGVALLPFRTVADDLESGRLVAALPEYDIPDRPFYAIYARTASPVAKIETFLDYVTRALADDVGVRRAA